MPTVYGSSGSAGVRVDVDLLASAPVEPGDSATNTVLGHWAAISDLNGAWELALPSNESVTPSGTYFRATERRPGGDVLTTFSVPRGSGRHALTSIAAAIDPNTAVTAAGLAVDLAARQPLAFGATRPSHPPVSSWITTFQPGHGFSNFVSSLTSVTDDTTNFTLGSQSLAAVTKTDNSGGSIQRTGIPAFDATGKSLVLVAKASEVANLTELILFAGNDSFTAYYQWTVQDGDVEAQRFFRSGEWAFITLSFADAAVIGSPNRAALTSLRLRTRSLTGTSITVNWQGVGLSPEQTAYPNGVVSISFDDSLGDTYTAARPVLDKYGFAATAYLIIDVIGTPTYMTLDQCRRLEAINGWDMAAHAWTLADHGTGLANLTTDALIADLSRMRAWLETNGFRGTRHLAYPLGNFSTAMIDVARRYFESGRTVDKRQRHETIPPPDPFKLRSPSLTNSMMPSSIWTAEIDRAFTNKTWLHLTFHGVVTSSPGTNQILLSDFTTIVDYIASKGMPVRTVRQVLEGA